MDFLPSLNPNILIIIVVALVVVYGVALGQSRLRMLVLSTFVGIVLASQLTPEIMKFAPSVPELQIRIALLALPILIFGLISGGHKSHNKGNFLLNVIAGLVAGALIVSSVLFVLPPRDLASATTDSLFASEIVNFRLAILAFAPIALLFGMAIRSKDKRH